MKTPWILILLLLLIPGILAGTTWYVRPAGGSYGSENGTSYANAWDGLLNVVWGGAGVVAGDELYICGTHTHVMTASGSITTQADITMSQGSSGSWITIRGDYGGDPGIVWSSYSPEYEAWVQHGSYPNVYSITAKADTFGDFIFEDLGESTYDSYVLMTERVDVATVDANPGSWCYDDNDTNGKISNGDTVYVRKTDSSNPDTNDDVFLNRYGYEFKPSTSSENYVIFQDIKLYYPFEFDWTNVDRIEFNGCTLWFAEDNMITLRNGCDNITLDGCDIRYFATGLYLISSDNGAPNYITAQNCTFYDADEPNGAPVGSGDYHGIGSQGGTGHLYQDNEFYNLGEGIVFYAYSNQDCTNTTVRRNYFHDLDPTKGNVIGVAYGNPSTWTAGTLTGNKCNYNIFVNTAVSGLREGIYYKWADEIQIYNNVFHGWDRSIQTGQAGVNIKLRNNISWSPTSYHIFFRADSAEGGYVIDSDYNCFYDGVESPTFYFRDTGGIQDGLSFAQWQALSKSGCTFDPNSITTDPGFLNGSGSWNTVTDWQINTSSNAKDAGTAVSLLSDYWDNNVPSGTDPDLGVHEFQQDQTNFEIQAGASTKIKAGASIKIKKDTEEKQ